VWVAAWTNEKKKKRKIWRKENQQLSNIWHLAIAARAACAPL